MFESVKVAGSSSRQIDFKIVAANDFDIGLVGLVHFAKSIAPTRNPPHVLIPHTF